MHGRYTPIDHHASEIGIPIVTRGIAHAHAHASKTEAQMLFLSAATAKALPNFSLLPAFVAGFVFSFSIVRPGTVNLPADFTSFVPTAARLASTFLQSAALSPVAVAIAAVTPDCDMAFAAAAFGAMPRLWWRSSWKMCWEP